MIYHSSTLRCGAAGALALFIPSLAGAQDDVAGLRIEYSASPQVAVIEYDLETMLEREDDTPLLRIYDDGLARVHHSRFMKLAGDFEMWLTDGEVASVLRLCHEGGVMTYDEQAVSAARREAESGRDRAASASGDTLTYRTDPAVSILRIRLDLYDAPGLPSPIADLRKEIRCADRQHEAAAVP